MNEKNDEICNKLGFKIQYCRKFSGLTQKMLAEKANISFGLLGKIEAPNKPHNFSLEVLFNIADVLEVDPADLISTDLFPENIISKIKDKE